jgi:O-phosphoseryl-tRNA synthetase
MDEDVSIDLGKWVVEEFLRPFGFEEFQFRQVSTGTDTYYAPGKHFEAFAHRIHSDDISNSESGWLEVADFGLYSPITLASYGIDYPVLNCGIGVERIAMLLHACEDIRALVYPQFYGEFILTDPDLVKLITLKHTPATPQGKEIEQAIVNVCLAHGADVSPASFAVWEGRFQNKLVQVSVVEPEENTKLCGPAFRNEIFVKDGNIIGAAASKGLSTGIKYIQAFAAEAAYAVEQAVQEGKNELEVRVRISRSPSDINLQIDPVAIRYITSRNKRIDLRGPVFTTVRMQAA